MSTHEIRLALLEWGKQHGYPDIHFDRYALGQGQALWSVILYCSEGMVDALADAIGIERAGEVSA